jgi:hypothetical protein
MRPDKLSKTFFNVGASLLARIERNIRQQAGSYAMEQCSGFNAIVFRVQLSSIQEI